MSSIRITLVLQNESTDPSEVSDVMSQAHHVSERHGFFVQWLTETAIVPAKFGKTDIVVFEKFEGSAFEALKSTKCARIVGPWCITSCMGENKPVPSYTWPIYNVAMYDCVICCSHLSKPKKEEIKRKVELMGGLFTPDLTPSATHLVTESVKSEKYIQASEYGFRLMTAGWVNQVWEDSQTSYIHCNNEQYNKFRCLPFYNLVISSTGIADSEKRKDIAQKIAENGGDYTSHLNLTKTDFLIVEGKSATLSEKYKAARSKNIPCISADWILDSLKKGYALHYAGYEVKKTGTSTPTKQHINRPDFSMISCIGDPVNKTSIEASFAHSSTKKGPLQVSHQKRKGSQCEELGKLIDGLDIKKAKKAGQFLDGCSVFLAGFSADQREKLCKILNLSGATRYDDISDRLTHIIIGDTSCPEAKILKTKNYPVTLVSIRWLFDSLEKKQPVDEENYLINLFEASNVKFNSPSGQKGLNLLRSDQTLTSSHFEAALNASMQNSQAEKEAHEDDILVHYRNSNSKEESDTMAKLLRDAGNEFTDFPSQNSISQQNSCADASQEPSKNHVFSSKKFVLIKFNADELECLTEQIVQNGGEIMPSTFRGIADFIVAPICLTCTIQETAMEVVNELWVFESIEMEAFADIVHYHRPMVVADTKPLENCVIGISNYVTYERDFLRKLVECLGGLFQDQFSRIERPEKNIYAATHLICPETDGKKYQAAIKWGVPVVNKDWLIECAKNGCVVEEDKYIVGDSKAVNMYLSNSKNNTTTTHVSGSVAPKSDNLDLNKSTPKVNKDTSRKNTPNKSHFKSVLTPLNNLYPLDITTSGKKPLNRISKQKNDESSPINKRLVDVLKSDVGGASGGNSGGSTCSQVTPVRKIIEETRTNLWDTPKTPFNRLCIDTPESLKLENFASESTKKIYKNFFSRNVFQSPVNPPPKSSPSFSEIRREVYAHFEEKWGKGGRNDAVEKNAEEVASCSSSHMDCDEAVTPQRDHAMETDDLTDSCAQNLLMSKKMEQLEEMVKSSVEKRQKVSRLKLQFTDDDADRTMAKTEESQPLTVNWDYSDEQPIPKLTKMRCFIISGVDAEIRQRISTKIEQLGAIISDFNASYDPQCTHLICAKPARNEKTLSCIAAGKWILHTSYIDKSFEAGHFLNEEEFEFGNPVAKPNLKLHFDKENEARINAIYWWRCEIHCKGKGAFKEMRAMVVAQKRDPIVRVIEAGGGTVVDIQPPFDGNASNLTHCLMEAKCVPDFSVYMPLVQQGVYCVNTLYISEYLFRTVEDIRDSVIPHFSKFYNN